MSQTTSAVGAPSADRIGPIDANGARLFALSFTALFLELMLIRWVPSVVRVVAYYANLLLIGSFLGLGLGAMLATRRMRLFRWFSSLLVLDLVVLWLSRQLFLPGATLEFRFHEAAPRAANYVALVGVFCANLAMFVPLGERIGELFQRLPPLRAYAWDLGGSLAGTLVFGLFSYAAFSPLVGLALVGAMYVGLVDRAERVRHAAPILVALAIVFVTTERRAHWSPYYYITVHEGAEADSPIVSQPVPRLREMMDPPTYSVRVNQDFYQSHGSIDPRRYGDSNPSKPAIDALRSRYEIAYKLRPEPGRVLVVGAGGGVDAEAALLAGATWVDAVEIDPQLIRLSDEFNAARPYRDPRVHVHNDDARAYFERADGKYDVVSFGTLDSQALFSSMSNIRLDGFVYTVESVRAAYDLLSDNGVLSLAFVAGAHPWLMDKLYGMVEDAIGRPPTAYYNGLTLVLCAVRGPTGQLPASVGPFQRVGVNRVGVPVATDDWPYLYLSSRTIPTDYLLTIASLLVISLLAILTIGRQGTHGGELDFLFLGMGFLLLETKSIVDCTLYFGATWVVTTVVITGVLLMVLLANGVASKLTRFRPVFYVPLLGWLLALYLVPREWVLGWPITARVGWVLLAVPLPVFFAGLIFSTRFRAASRPSVTLGLNLVGATFGGFAEYLGMAIGFQKLSLLAIAAYLAAYVVGRRAH